MPLTMARLRIEHLWLLVPAVIVVWMSFLHPLPDLDFWWHLKVGEIIATSGEIPKVDLFSFTQSGTPFMHQNWLGEVLYYRIYQVGGLPLLVAFNAVLLLLAFVPIYHLCLEASGRRIAILSAVLAAGVLSLYSNMRPQTYSFVLFALFYWIVWGYRAGRRDYLWLLPLLMVLWVNLHGAFVLGISILGLVLVTETVRRAVRGPRPDTLGRAALSKLALILCLTLIATLANPETYRVFAYVRKLQVDPASQLFVAEWQVPNIKQMGGLLVFFGPFFVVMLALIYSRRRPTLPELGLLLTFAVLGLAAMRSGVWFALIAGPILARHAAALAMPDLLDEVRRRPHLGWLVRRIERRRQRQHPQRYGLNWAVLAVVLVWTVILSPWVRPQLEAPALRPWLVEQGTPIGAVNYIAEHNLTGNIFHPQTYGDYLIWRLWPQQRSFMDGRVHLYDESFVRNYLMVFYDDNWESRIARYDIKYLLLPNADDNAAGVIQDARSSEGWTLLYEDAVSVLFEKQLP